MRKTERLLAKQALLLSLLLHLLLAASFIAVIARQEPHEKSPAMYIPSYTQAANEQSKAAESQEASEQGAQNNHPTKTETEPLDKDQIALSHETEQREIKQQMKRLAMTNRQNEAVSIPSKNTEALHLVGDKSVAIKPLVRILGHALSSHLAYPKIAVDFLLRGTAYVGFVIHPNGDVTDVRLVESSGAGVLDAAAVAGVRAISPVKDVAKYVPQAKYLVVGIIFG